MSRGTRFKMAVLFVLSAVVLTQAGCGSMTLTNDRSRGSLRKTDIEAPSLSVDTSDPTAASPAATDDPLVGTWTFKGMVATGSGKDVKWSVSPNTGELVITRTADGYALGIGEGTSMATLDGNKVVLERNFPAQRVFVRYTGTLAGDTITGSQHTVINGAEHDDPWTAERVK